MRHPRGALGGRRRAAAIALAVLVVAAAAAGGLAAVRGSGGAPPLAVGAELSPPRPVPSVPLVAANGRHVTLAGYRGRVVVLAPFLSLCAEQCPITTGAFMQAAQRIAAAGLSRKVVFVEASVDPWRDTPRRLRAFQRMIHDRGVVMLTGTRSDIRSFWGFFGIWYHRVPEDSPPDVDWWTHRPQRFDVEHTDAVLLIDPAGRWRVADLGMADPGGRIPSRLRRLLNASGLKNLREPKEAWSVPQLIQDIGHVLGQPVPAAGARGG
jgi:protein SCO1